MAKGMFKPLRVTVPTNDPVPEPLSVATITLRDFVRPPCQSRRGRNLSSGERRPADPRTRTNQTGRRKAVDDAVEYITTVADRSRILIEEPPAGISAVFLRGGESESPAALLAGGPRNRAALPERAATAFPQLIRRQIACQDSEPLTA